LDAGIIRSFKAHYRRFFLEWVLTQIETETGVQNMDLLTCISLILRAWNQVSERTIRNCWAHTAIMSAPMAAKLIQQNEPKRSNLESELDILIKKLSLNDPMSVEEYISFDDEIECERNEEESEQFEEEENSEDEQTVFTHREALHAASKLLVYSHLHELKGESLEKIIDESRYKLHASAKQTRIDSFFSTVN
jgi:hypothetical protein